MIDQPTIKQNILFRQRPPLTPPDDTKSLKQGIWLYFLLLIFEGALRKWFLPQLATPLLIVRDPVALWIILVAYSKGITQYNVYVTIVVVTAFVGTITAITLGHGNIIVAIYGARILLFHFPLMFVIGKVFERNDVIKLGKATIWIAIPMTVLITMQFYSPQTAWVNHGIGNKDGEGFSGALNYFRPPATFSFNNGTTLFYSFVAPFILYFWLDTKKISIWVLIVATACLLAAIPLSISRGLFFQVLVSLIFMLVAILRNPKYISKMVLAVVGGAIVLTALSRTSFFQTATEAFMSRFESANEAEGGVQSVLLDRYLGGLAFALSESPGTPALGYGLGMGTNVGSMLLSGEIIFLISEGEWGRVIGELGPLFGLVIVFIRIRLTSKVVAQSYSKLIADDLLPWMLLSFGALMIAQGGWAQPTSLGFFVMSGGLLFALGKPAPIYPRAAHYPKKRLAV